MAKGAGKLAKLRSALKKLGSFGGRLKCGSSAISAVESTRMRTVYVGRTRREYRVDAALLRHPAMRELLETPADGSDEIVVGCEAVLFDHLRWMIETSDPQAEQLDDLADFYAY